MKKQKKQFAYFKEILNPDAVQKYCKENRKKAPKMIKDWAFELRLDTYNYLYERGFISKAIIYFNVLD